MEVAEMERSKKEWRHNDKDIVKPFTGNKGGHFAKRKRVVLDRKTQA